MLFKNVASQKIHVYAYDSTTGAAKTGDAANITAYVSLDGTANAIDDTNPTEVDATNMPGVYVFDLTQAETNCNSFALYAKSATSNIRIEPIIGFTTGAANSLSVTTGVNSDKTGYTLTATTGLGNQTANITGTVSGNSTHSAADVKTAIEAAGSHLTLILEDTGTTLPSTLSTILTDTDELQEAITDGGRTDLLIDAIKAKTDLMLDAAAIRSAVGLASANLDTQLADLPTVSEFEARTIAAANYATAASVTTIDTLLDKFAPLLIGTVSGAGTASEVFVYGGVTATVVADVDGNRTSVTFS